MITEITIKSYLIYFILERSKSLIRVYSVQCSESIIYCLLQNVLPCWRLESAACSV